MTMSDFRPNRRSLIRSAAAFAALPLGAASFTSHALAKAPMLGVTQPKHRRYRVGGFEITTISDSEVFIDGPYPLIGGNASEEDVERLMTENLLPTDTYQPGFSPTVINTGREIVLFDTGNGENGFVSRPEGGWLARELGPAGFKPEDIDIVVLTHGHSDHFGGVLEGDALLFPNARYVISQVEHDFWWPEGKHTGKLADAAALYRRIMGAVEDRLTFVKDGDDVVSGIRTVEAFGHTPGHLNFLIETEGQSLYMLADCAHHHVASLARPDWHCVFDVEPEQAAATRKRVFDMVVTEKYPVIGYHMPFPSVGYIERLPTSGYRWIAHSYQLDR